VVVVVAVVLVVVVVVGVPHTPNIGLAFPGGVVGFMQLRLQQLMSVAHRWPSGLQPFARASVLKTSVVMTARTATPSAPRTRCQSESARAEKPRNTCICGPPLGCRSPPPPTGAAEPPANGGAGSPPPHALQNRLSRNRCGMGKGQQRAQRPHPLGFAAARR